MVKHFGFILTAALVWASCDGESSSRIDVYASGGPRAGGVTTTGGNGAGGTVVGKTGGVIIGTGGFPSQTGGVPTGILVRGGVRDPASTQCSQSSDGCPVNGSYLTCLDSICKTALATCYQVDPATGVVKGGTCAAYAKCQMACPCDTTRAACEATCVGQFVTTDPACTTCMALVYSCGMKANCGEPVSCGTSAPVPTGGVSAGGTRATGGYTSTGGTRPSTGGILVSPPPGGSIVLPPSGGAIVVPRDAGRPDTQRPDTGTTMLGPNCLQAVSCCQSIAGTAIGAALCGQIISSAGTTETGCAQVVRALQVNGYCTAMGY